MGELEDIPIDQSQRFISVERSPVGNTKILVCSFQGAEELSALSRFTLEVMSLGRALQPGEMIGKPLTIALHVHGRSRRFSGIVSRLVQLTSSVRNHFLHVVELAPPLWMLTLNQTCQLYHEMKSSDIISGVMSKAASPYKPCSSVNDVPEREYTVQYCESDFNLVTRLLEEEGLFYRFDFDDDDCPMIAGNGEWDFFKMDPHELKLFTDLSDWEPHYEAACGSYRHGDFDFKIVDVLDGNASSLNAARPPAVPSREAYEYPGRFATNAIGGDLAKARMGEQETKVVAITGRCAEVTARPGAKFAVQLRGATVPVDLPATNMKSDTFVMTRVEHRLRDFGGTPFNSGVDPEYTNGFVCMPTDFTFRPARLTPKPQIRGPQTARVTDGPDEYGRVKVRFQWLPQDDSCWIRVAQTWAYKSMGTQFLPRMDSEVVVDFEDADPDRPLIVGMLYNGKNDLLYKTPDMKTQSGIRGANWGDAGVADKSNELRFEDKAGSEEIFLHAQKDFRRVVVNNDTLTVENGNRKIEIQTGDVTVEVSKGNVSETVSMGNVTETVSLGNYDIKVDAGKMSITAMQSITLTVGANSITIDLTGVTIKGTMVTVQGEATAKLTSPMTEVDGEGMLTLKGGVVMIN